MLPTAPLALAALLWGVPAGALMRPAAPEAPAPCRAAVWGDPCHEQVQLAMNEGIERSPQRYANLSAAATFEEVQAFPHGLESSSEARARGARAADGVPSEGAPPAPVREARAELKPLAEAGSAASARPRSPGALQRGAEQEAPGASQPALPYEDYASEAEVAREEQVGPTAARQSETQSTGEKLPDISAAIEDVSGAVRAIGEDISAALEPIRDEVRDLSGRVRRLEETAAAAGEEATQPAAEDSPPTRMPPETARLRGDEQEALEASQPALSYEDYVSEAEIAKEEQQVRPTAAGQEPETQAEIEPLAESGTPPPTAPAGPPAAASQAPSATLGGAAPPAPQSAGCYVWLPGGCIKRRIPASQHWRRDVWGEAHAQAGRSAQACQARKRAFDNWCGVADAVMLLAGQDELTVPEGQTQNTGEQLPQGAPRQPEEQQQQQQEDPFLEDDEPRVAERPAEQAEPEVSEKQSEARDEHEQLPEGAPALPNGTGCFVWLPSGCNSAHKIHAKFHWRRDWWGERNARAGESAAACRARKHSFDSYCGVEDAVTLPMLATPDATPAAAAPDAARSHGDGAPTEQVPTAAEPALAAAAAKHTDPAGRLASVEVRQPAPPQAHEAKRWQVVAGAVGDREGRALASVLVAPPRAEGCYVFMPSGCEGRSFEQGAWLKVKQRSDVDKLEACAKHKHFYDLWCDASDAVMAWVHA